MLSKSAKVHITATQRRSSQYTTLQEKADSSKIRENLKQWQIENDAENAISPLALPFKSIGRRAEIANEVRFDSMGQNLSQDDEIGQDDMSNFSPFQKDDLVDVGGHRTFLLPGDLVELL